MTQSKIMCPVCGVTLPPGLIPALRKASFPCSRCRTELEVTASDPLPFFAVSLVFAFSLCVVLGMRGFVLILATIGVAAAFYLVGRLVRSVAATPKLKRRDSSSKLPLETSQSKPVYRPIRSGRLP